MTPIFRARAIQIVVPILLLPVPAIAQSPELTVRMLGVGRDQPLECHAGGSSFTVTTNSSGEGSVTLSATGQTLSIICRRIGYRPAHLVVELNGSGYVSWNVATGEAKQWPVVTWSSTGARLDVFMNGSSLGTTEAKRGVQPETNHRFEWRKVGGSTTCSTSASLPWNVTRKYTCNADTGAVTVE